MGRELTVEIDKTSDKYRICPECQKEFMAKRSPIIFCSEEHKVQHNKKKAQFKKDLWLHGGKPKPRKVEKRHIVLNNCKHYFLNEGGYDRLYFTDDPNFVEVDLEMTHPMGLVYKPKGVLGNMVRFVRQPNNTILIFNIKEWNDDKNPYFKNSRHNLIIEIKTLWSRLTA